jgi:rod shape-determining protein MreC
MRAAPRKLSRLAVPLKALLDRFTMGLMVALAIALLVVGKADLRVVDYVNTRIGDLFAPLLAVAVEPLAASRRLAADIGEHFALREENARLREQNRRLLEWQAVAERLSIENAALRDALNVPAEPALQTAVTARVVADSGGPFLHTRLINAGAGHGVEKGMAVMNDRGMVGRVIEVGRRSSRILLLTDFNSRVPVLVGSSRDQAILAGDNTPMPELIFLPLNPRLAVGDRVLTSGRGGLLPPGLPIGRIASVEESKVAVATLVDWERLDYVRLLSYAGVRPPEPLPGPPAPAPAPAQELPAVSELPPPLEATP